MEHAQHCDALEPEIARFVGLIEGTDFDVPVPSCPGWDLAELIRHQGLVHRWAEWHVRTLAQSRHSQADLGLIAPANDALVEWFAEGGAQLLATLRAVDPDMAMWAWGADQHAWFWSRRQLHETVIHRVDAELALGIPSRVDGRVAIDGIDELLTNIGNAAYFAPNTLKLVGNGESIHLHCTDAAKRERDGEWMIHLEPDGLRWEHGHDKGTVAVRGTAADLLLMMYNRASRTGDAFTTFGDVALLDFWLANSAL